MCSRLTVRPVRLHHGERRLQHPPLGLLLRQPAPAPGQPRRRPRISHRLPLPPSSRPSRTGYSYWDFGLCVPSFFPVRLLPRTAERTGGTTMPHMSPRSEQGLQAKPPRRRHWGGGPSAACSRWSSSPSWRSSSSSSSSRRRPPLALPRRAPPRRPGSSTAPGRSPPVGGRLPRPGDRARRQQRRLRSAPATSPAPRAGQRAGRAATFVVSLAHDHCLRESASAAALQSLDVPAHPVATSPWPGRSRCPRCSPREPRSPGRHRPRSRSAHTTPAVPGTRKRLRLSDRALPGPSSSQRA